MVQVVLLIKSIVARTLIAQIANSVILVCSLVWCVMHYRERTVDFAHVHETTLDPAQNQGLVLSWSKAYRHPLLEEAAGRLDPAQSRLCNIWITQYTLLWEKNLCMRRFSTMALQQQEDKLEIICLSLVIPLILQTKTKTSSDTSVSRVGEWNIWERSMNQKHSRRRVPHQGDSRVDS